MSKEKQIDYKEFARQMRQVATVFNGAEPAVVCSKELWESIAGEIESFAGYRKQSDLTPCDVCRFNPPTSGDGKPCFMCPAQMKGGAE